MNESARWQAILDATVPRTAGLIHTHIVLDETESTQDACRQRTAAKPGLCVTALRQTAGRGRRGARWIDDAGLGVALTLSIAMEPTDSGRIALATGVGAHRALTRFVPAERLGVKWPNDIVLRHAQPLPPDHPLPRERKLAGILVEAADGLGLIGIGVNVAQRQWEGDLETTAVSLAEITGDAPDRAAVAAALVEEVSIALLSPWAGTIAAFESLDVLTGTRRLIERNGSRHRGTVTAVEPGRGVRIRLDDGRDELLRADDMRIV